MTTLIYFRKKRNHTYAIVSDPKKKSAVDMVTVPKSKASSLEINPTRDDIHDGSENEENNGSKMSMKNILYEPGKFYAFFYVSIYIYTNFDTYKILSLSLFPSALSNSWTNSLSHNTFMYASHT